MDRRGDLLVAGGAVASAFAVVLAGELLGGIGGPLLRSLPLFVFFLFSGTHDPDRGGLDQPRYWLALSGVVALVAIGWLAL